MPVRNTPGRRRREDVAIAEKQSLKVRFMLDACVREHTHPRAR